MIGVLTFAALFVDMAIDGVPRLDSDFFTTFPSRRAGAGRASCRRGSASTLVMLVTASPRCRSASAAGVYLEEYAPKNWSPTSSRSTSPTSPACPRSSTACWRWAVRLPVRLRAEHPLGRAHAGAADPADRHRGHARGDPRDSRSDPRGPTRWARPSGRRLRTTSLPYSPAGILTGVIIGMSRAIGETAPIITIGALTFIAFLPPRRFSGDPPFVSLRLAVRRRSRCCRSRCSTGFRGPRRRSIRTPPPPGWCWC